MFCSILTELIPVEESRKTYETTWRIQVRSIFSVFLGAFPLFSLMRAFLPLLWTLLFFLFGRISSLPVMHSPRSLFLFSFFKGTCITLLFGCMGEWISGASPYLNLLFPMPADVPSPCSYLLFSSVLFSNIASANEKKQNGGYTLGEGSTVLFGI